MVSGFTGTVQTNGSHAGGLDYVPYNRLRCKPAFSGEMVLTAKEADSYRKGREKRCCWRRDYYPKHLQSGQNCGELMQRGAV